MDVGRIVRTISRVRLASFKLHGRSSLSLGYKSSCGDENGSQFNEHVGH